MSLRVKLVIRECSFEAEGEDETVLRELREFYDRILDSSSEQSAGGATGGGLAGGHGKEFGSINLISLFEQKAPKTGAEEMATIAHWLKEHESKAEFSPVDLKKGYSILHAKLTHVTPPADIANALAKAKMNTGFFEVGSKSGLWRLAEAGETWVEFGSPGKTGKR